MRHTKHAQPPLTAAAVLLGAVHDGQALASRRQRRQQVLGGPGAEQAHLGGVGRWPGDDVSALQASSKLLAAAAFCKPANILVNIHLIHHPCGGFTLTRPTFSPSLFKVVHRQSNHAAPKSKPCGTRKMNVLRALTLTRPTFSPSLLRWCTADSMTSLPLPIATTTRSAWGCSREFVVVSNAGSPKSCMLQAATTGK